MKELLHGCAVNFQTVIVITTYNTRSCLDDMVEIIDNKYKYTIFSGLSSKY